MDRSGEKNLNPYDTHAIEAAMQLREGGAVEVDEIAAVTMGPDSEVTGPAQGGLAGRRTGRFTERRGARGLGRCRHRVYALAKALEKEVARPGAATASSPR